MWKPTPYTAAELKTEPFLVMVELPSNIRITWEVTEETTAGTLLKELRTLDSMIDGVPYCVFNSDTQLNDTTRLSEMGISLNDLLYVRVQHEAAVDETVFDTALSDNDDQESDTISEYISVVLPDGQNTIIHAKKPISGGEALRHVRTQHRLTGRPYQLVQNNQVVPPDQVLSRRGIKLATQLHVMKYKISRGTKDSRPTRKNEPGSVYLLQDRQQCIDELADIVFVSAGPSHWAAINKEGVLYTWGDNTNGALGRDGDSSRPASVGGLVDIAIACCGGTFTMALNTHGHLYAWGVFVDGDGNVGPTGQYPRPTLVDVKLNPRETFVNVVAGITHILALTSQGRVFTWGYGGQYQLGRTVVERHRNSLRMRPLALSNIVYIACGQFHSFAIDKWGDVWVWGLNTNGQTGIQPKLREKNIDGKIVTTVVEHFVTSPTVADVFARQAKQISAAKMHTLVLYKNGTVRSFGDRAAIPPDIPLACSVAAGELVDLIQTVGGRIFQRKAGNSVWDEVVRRCTPLAITSGMVLALPPKCLVLDLNGVVYDKTTGVVRPHLAEFLAFAFAHFDVMVWSSGQPRIVEHVVNAYFGEYKTRLLATWARDMLGLTSEQYSSDCPTIKDLGMVWKVFRQYGQHNTILVDDTLSKAEKQPNNLVCPSRFDPEQTEKDDELLCLIEYLEILKLQKNVAAYIEQHPYCSTA